VLSEAENLRVYKNKKIFEDALQSATPQTNPIVIILGGQNASGKSTLGKKFLEECRKNGGSIVRVENDALREYHPLFAAFVQDDEKMMPAYTAKDVGRWTRRLIEDLGRNRYNMLIETTMRSPEVICETARRLHHEAGYDVQVNVFVVSYDKSLVGCFRRYERMQIDYGFGRFVHDHALKAAYAGMPETLQALKAQNVASHIHLRTREQPLFTGDYRTTDIVGIVNQERRREFTAEETAFLRDQWKEVFALMHSRNAGKDEFLEITNRMSDRVQTMVAEEYPQTNINAIVDICHELTQELHNIYF
jgi:UDP-N-acetylglucosamine kinase